MSYDTIIFVAATNTANTGSTQPSAAAPRISSHDDTTLIDNDLYE